MTIYIDVLLALNLFIDFLLLSACSYVMRLPRRRGRLVLGAAIGSASACLVLLPAPPAAVSLLVNAAVAALMVRTAFAWSGWKPFAKQLAVFYITSALFAGVAFAVWFFFAPQGFTVIRGVVYYDMSPLMLALLTGAAYLAICVYDRVTRKRMAKGGEYRLTIDCGEGALTLRALYDTGHHVADPFTGSPVAIAHGGALAGRLPAGLAQALAAGEGDAAMGGQAAGGVAVAARLRMIPCRTVAGTALLPAFKPDRAWIALIPGTPRDVTGLYIAVAPELGRGDYDAIVGTDIAGKAGTA